MFFRVFFTPIQLFLYCLYDILLVSDTTFCQTRWRGLRMEFKDKLKALRERQGVSQYKMADETSLSRSVISNIEQGRSLPTMDQCKVLSEYFNVSISDLIDSQPIAKSSEEQLLEQIETYFAENKNDPNQLIRFHKTINEIFYNSISNK